MVYYGTMKTLALSLMLVLTVNGMAAVNIWDTTSFSDVDPWELTEEVEEEETVVVTSGFNA
jgi:hypothetical protein